MNVAMIRLVVQESSNWVCPSMIHGYCAYNGIPDTQLSMTNTVGLNPFSNVALKIGESMVLGTGSHILFDWHVGDHTSFDPCGDTVMTV